MSRFRSWLGGALTTTYLILAIYIAQDEVRNSHGGWINLRGFGTVLVTAPSQIVFGSVLKIFGVAGVNYADLGFSDYSRSRFTSSSRRASCTLSARACIFSAGRSCARLVHAGRIIVRLLTRPS